MKQVTEPQMNLMVRLKGGARVQLDEINTLTLASTMRRGYVRPLKKVVKLTPLGEQVYRWNMRKEIHQWKQDLEKARDLKRASI